MLVAAVVDRVGRFQIGRHPLGVDARQAVAEQSEPEATAAIVGMGAEQAEVVVRRLARVRGLKE